MQGFLRAVERGNRRRQAQASADPLVDLRNTVAWEDRHGGDDLPDIRRWEPGARRGR
jgi:hypothetical protein